MVVSQVIGVYGKVLSRVPSDGTNSSRCGALDSPRQPSFARTALVMDKRASNKDKGLKFSRASFWIGLATFLVLFALLAFGSILGIVGLIRMLWKVLGGS